VCAEDSFGKVISGEVKKPEKYDLERDGVGPS